MTEKNIIIDPYSYGADGEFTSFAPEVHKRNRYLIKKATGFEFPDGTRVIKSDMLTAADGKPLFSTEFDTGGERIIWTGRDGTTHGNRTAGAKAILPEQP